MKKERQERYLNNIKWPKHPKNKTAYKLLRLSVDITYGLVHGNTRTRRTIQRTSISVFEDYAEAAVRASVGGDERILHLVREYVILGKRSYKNPPKPEYIVDYIKYFSINKHTGAITKYRAYLGKVEGGYGINAIHDVTHNKWIPVVGNDKIVKAMQDYFKSRPRPITRAYKGEQ